MTNTTTSISEVIQAIVAKYPTEDELLKHVTIIHPGDPVFTETPFIDYIETDVLINYEQRKLVIKMGNNLVYTLSVYEIISLFEKYPLSNKLYAWLNNTNYLNDKNAGDRLNKLIQADRITRATFIKNFLPDQSTLMRNTNVRMLPALADATLFENDDLSTANLVFIVSCGELQLHLTLEDMSDLARHYSENNSLINRLNSIKLYN